MKPEPTNQIITRFPPSPTGWFHVGSARTALFNYLFALQQGGRMIVRFEDTDRARSKPEYEENAIASLRWLSIDQYDPAPRQSERTAVYREYLEKLIADDRAYISQEQPEDEEQGVEEKRREVIRFRNPGQEITFTDLIRGEITVDTSDLGDFVIAKSLDEPLYHLTVVVDDYEGGVTHIIRGEDHISNTPRQILIQEAFGAPRPLYAHLPLLLGPDRSKLSKRHGAQTIDDLRTQGFLPAAVINYLALLGWNPGTEQEVFTLEELITSFDIKQVQKGGAIFNLEKLRWLNKQHIANLDDDLLIKRVEEFLPNDITILPQYNPIRLKQILPILRERIETFADITTMAEGGELEYFFEQPDYDAASLIWRQDTDHHGAEEYLAHSAEVLSTIPQADFKPEILKETLWHYASEKGRGSVLWPLRYALSGRDQSPDPFVLAASLGKEETLNRIKFAQEKLQTL